MIGLVVATHGFLGASLLETAAMIVGGGERACAVALSREHSAEELQRRMSEAVEAVRSPGGVLIAADMFGGTPANVALTLVEAGRTELLTGVNLPMLLKFFSYRERLSLEELADLLQSQAREGIVLGSALLSRQA